MSAESRSVTSHPDPLKPRSGADRPGGTAAAVRRAMLGRPARLGFVVVAAGLGVAAVAGERAGIAAALGRLEPSWVVASTGCVLVGLGLQMWLWRTLLAALGSPLPAAAAARVYYVSQLGKYVPGSVWVAVAQMELARDRGVARNRSALAFVLLMVHLAASGGLIACAVAPALADGPGRWVVVPLLAAASVCLIHPGVVGRAIAVLLRWTGRAPLDTALSWRSTVRVAVIASAHWVVLGLSVWLLALGLGAPPLRSLAAALGGFALAWAAGVVVVLAPAGAGVREVVLVGALLPVLDRGDAITVAILSRVVTIAVDLGLAGAALLARGGAAASPPGEDRSDGG